MTETTNIHGTDEGNLTPVLPFIHLAQSRYKALQELLDAPSHVYFIYSAGRVKIGFSTRWQGRVDEVCQGCGHESELILVMPGDRKMERDYHALFSASRETGEWFRLDGDVRRFLDLYASAEGREVLNLAHDGFIKAGTYSQ